MQRGGSEKEKKGVGKRTLLARLAVYTLGERELHLRRKERKKEKSAFLLPSS